MAYSVKSTKSGKTYYLHSRDQLLKGGHRQTIYFFASQAKDGVLNEVPQGYQVTEARTGLPILAKK
jgi:YHS domain-containing protein